MALVTWSNKYLVGVETLDNQHKAFVKVLNELHSASMKGEARKVAGPLLRHLASIANEHFTAEEKLMESIKFPGLAAHRAKHKELSGRVAEFASRHEKGDVSVYSELLRFTGDWLTSHMKGEDQEYVAWMSAHRTQS
jgi:hemerythrin